MTPVAMRNVLGVTTIAVLLVASPATAGARLLCYPPYLHVMWLIQGAPIEPTYCGSVRQSRVDVSGFFFGLGVATKTVSMAKAEKLARFPLYFPAKLPHFDYSSLYAGLQIPGDSNDHRGFTIKRNFIDGYFNYGFHAGINSDVNFFLLSAADAAFLGDDGVFHCADDLETLESPVRIEICSPRRVRPRMARWWSPDGKVLIALHGGLTRDEVITVAASMTPLKDVDF